MVSTRGYRYKFSGGERVLCYEPDPTKVKVLYDSKVLEVIESKDRRGRRSIEYLIHFQGWNSSWDRCVNEDFVLKDTEENRQLQRELAEKSQLQLGAYLYRRERKHGGSMSTGSGAAKRARLGFSEDGSMGTPLPANIPDIEVPEVESFDKLDTSQTATIDAEGPDEQPPPVSTGRATITLPQNLKDRLTFDYHLVVKRGRVLRVPANPCVAEILESFVKWFARAGAWHPPRGRHDPPQKPNLLDVSARLNLVREVADGLRVYFDFVLRGHLLYAKELAQYELYCGTNRFKADAAPLCGYLWPSSEASCFRDIMAIDDAAFVPKPIKVEEIMDPALAAAVESLKSPKLPEYSHLPPDPIAGPETRPASKETKPDSKAMKWGSKESNSDIQEIKQELKEPNHTVAQPAVPLPPEVAIKVEPCVSANNDVNMKIEPLDNPAPPLPPPVIRKPLARRLRSHKSALSHSEEEPGPSTSFDMPSSSICSSSSSRSEGMPRPLPVPITPTRTPLSLLLDKVAKWQIIPREAKTDHLPCRVYGAIHLTRLFLKLPEFLRATNMPDFKLKLVVKHIDLFVNYVHEHPEWFGDIQYEPSPPPRPH